MRHIILLACAWLLWQAPIRQDGVVYYGGSGFQLIDAYETKNDCDAALQQFRNDTLLGQAETPPRQPTHRRFCLPQGVPPETLHE